MERESGRSYWILRDELVSYAHYARICKDYRSAYMHGILYSVVAFLL